MKKTFIETPENSLVFTASSAGEYSAALKAENEYIKAHLTYTGTSLDGSFVYKDWTCASENARVVIATNADGKPVATVYAGYDINTENKVKFEAGSDGAYEGTVVFAKDAFSGEVTIDNDHSVSGQVDAFQMAVGDALMSGSLVLDQGGQNGKFTITHGRDAFNCVQVTVDVDGSVTGSFSAWKSENLNGTINITRAAGGELHLGGSVFLKKDDNAKGRLLLGVETANGQIGAMIADKNAPDERFLQLGIDAEGNPGGDHGFLIKSKYRVNDQCFFEGNYTATDKWDLKLRIGQAADTYTHFEYTDDGGPGIKSVFNRTVGSLTLDGEGTVNRDASHYKVDTTWGDWTANINGSRADGNNTIGALVVYDNGDVKGGIQVNNDDTAQGELKFTHGSTTLAAKFLKNASGGIEAIASVDTTTQDGAMTVTGLASYAETDSSIKVTVVGLNLSATWDDGTLTGSYSLKSESNAIGHGLTATFSKTASWGTVNVAAEIFHKRDDFTGSETKASGFLKLIINF